MIQESMFKHRLTMKLLLLRSRCRILLLRARKRATPLLRRLAGLDVHRLLRTGKLAGFALLIVVVFGLFPAPFVEVEEAIPFFGDFTWQTDTPIRFSSGDFRERGRGGLDDYVPKLRLLEYTIERGDTLWSISRKHELDPDSIISCNVFGNVHAIQQGDTILIPNIRGIFVNVSEGDTIFQYSTTYRVAPDFIMEVNDLRTNELTPGMKIFLPGVRFTNIERAYALGEAFSKPVRGRLTSRYGYRRDPFTGKRSFHRGIDLANRVGSRVYAAQEGRVIYTGPRYGYGQAVIIEHRFGYKTLYGHLDRINVKRRQYVKSGQIIGAVGNSGRSTGPHVHFEIWHKNRTIDPLTQTNMSVR
jgi:murein DD-endopeptidase MepM/ murein hydrolase activator NlpD